MSCRFAIAIVCSLAATQVAAATIRVMDAKGNPLEGAQVVVVDEGEHKTLSAETDNAGVATVDLDPGTKVSILCAHQGFRGWQQADVELVEAQTIKMKPAKDWSSLLLTEPDGLIPGLDGQLTVIRDQNAQIRLYSEDMLIGEKRQTLIPIKLKQKVRLTDSGRNTGEIAVIGTAGSAILIDLNVRIPAVPKAPAKDAAHFAVRDRRGNPMANAHVVLVNVRNNIHVGGRTNELGELTLKDFPNDPMVVYCAHQDSRAFRDLLDLPHGLHTITLVQEGGIGSAVFPGGGGSIRGLAGSFDPRLDNIGRYYMYADNIAIDGGKQQPIYYSLGQTIQLTDVEGINCHLVVVDVKGKTCLLEYRFP